MFVMFSTSLYSILLRVWETYIQYHFQVGFYLQPNIHSHYDLKTHPKY